MPNTNRIDSFQGEYRFLSNFYPVNGGVIYREVVFPTAEHAYQAAKVTILRKHSSPLLKIFADIPKPGDAKILGSIVECSNEQREEMIPVMWELLFLKFKEPVLKKLLLLTEDALLVEGNYWGDTFWGQVNGVGENNLGKILMSVRTNL